MSRSHRLPAFPSRQMLVSYTLECDEEADPRLAVLTAHPELVLSEDSEQALAERLMAAARAVGSDDDNEEDNEHDGGRGRGDGSQMGGHGVVPSRPCYCQGAAGE